MTESMPATPVTPDPQEYPPDWKMTIWTVAHCAWVRNIPTRARQALGLPNASWTLDEYVTRFGAVRDSDGVHFTTPQVIPPVFDFTDAQRQRYDALSDAVDDLNRADLMAVALEDQIPDAGTPNEVPEFFYCHVTEGIVFADGILDRPPVDADIDEYLHDLADWVYARTGRLL